MGYYLERYSDENEKKWDDFLEKDSINGTFLQTRRFLNYHPKERFKDASYMIYDDKKNLAALCPACEIIDDGKKVFFSHKGSTFGGIIFNKKNFMAEKVLQIIDALEEQVKADGFEEIWLKITSATFAKERDDLLRYCLGFKGFTEYKELNLVVEFEGMKEPLISNLAQGKRTNVHNCEKAGLELRVLDTDEQIEQFHAILTETLSKYGVKPVHTVPELLDLKNNRIQKECEFFGLYLDGEMIAGSMMFYFLNAKTAHTQYLCAKHEYNTLSPMTYMYYSMMAEAQKNGFERVSWGIATEDLGKEINVGLCKSKEAFGSKYSINSIYSKNLS